MMQQRQQQQQQQGESQPGARGKDTRLLSPKEERAPQNIMYDRRVCRGSTYPHRAPAPACQRPRKSPQRQAPRQSSAEGQKEGARAANRTPEPVHGRQHSEAQTMTYLEVLEQKAPEQEQSQQTDPLLDQPDSPRYVPKPGGEHKSTQIEAGDLFDFDLEAEPLLEVLVGKALDLAVMDVVDETEQAELCARRDQFEQMRNVELAETQRIEARETRLFEEKQRRKQQEKERLRHEAELATKLAARTVSKTMLEDLQGRVLGQLQAKGHFHDPVVAQVGQDFLPWVVKRAGDRLGAVADAGRIVQAAVIDAVSVARQTDLAIAGARQALLKQRHDESVALQTERERAAALLAETAAAAESNPAAELDSGADDAPAESVAEPTS